MLEKRKLPMGKLTVKGKCIVKTGNLSYTNIIVKQATIPKKRVRIKEMRIALEIERPTT